MHHLKLLLLLLKLHQLLITYPNEYRLIEALAKHYNISSTNVIVEAGANQLLEDGKYIL
ncbi:hypothetical protein [Rickettsia canadensis]|uniref:hypothetical protein n=1 Tax=Rickettsia canadensis TaxID=788 RepID=UPI00031C5B23|nr:hypothetical protein [Rickettsia canadensis]